MRIPALILLTMLFCACGRSGQQATLETPPSPEPPKVHNPSSKDITVHAYADSTYTDAAGRSFTIQTSYPKGGSLPDGTRSYADSNGVSYGHGVFWGRIVNESDVPLELDAVLPAEPFDVPNTPDSFFKLVFLKDTMTIDQVGEYGYGAKGVRAHLDTVFYKPTTVKRTIPPNESTAFYVSLMSHLSGTGVIRTEFIAEGENLFYKVNIKPQAPTLIPCGRISFKTP